MPIEGDYNGIRYFSCLELAYILRCEAKKVKIRNCDLPPLPYVANGRPHLYYPDFIAGESLIVEIKGLIIPKNKEKIIQKRLALEEFCRGSNYSCAFVTKEQISKHYIQKAKKFHNASRNGS